MLEAQARVFGLEMGRGGWSERVTQSCQSRRLDR